MYLLLLLITIFFIIKYINIVNGDTPLLILKENSRLMSLINENRDYMKRYEQKSNEESGSDDGHESGSDDGQISTNTTNSITQTDVTDSITQTDVTDVTDSITQTITNTTNSITQTNITDFIDRF
jgi:hypothetical protein